MPATQYNDAYGLLEKSFREAPLQLKAHKALPKPQELDQRTPPAGPVQPLDTADDEGASESAMLVSPMSSPILLNGHESGLPPTPPSNLLDHRQNANFSPPAFADGVMSSLLPRKSTASTPINQRSPPTPDHTPPAPAALQSPPQRHPSQLSSRAESFRTAREEQWQSDEEDQRPGMGFWMDGTTDERPRPRPQFLLPTSAVPDVEYLNSMRPRSMQQVQNGFGAGRADSEEDDDPTPTEVRPTNGLKGTSTEKAWDPIERVPNREWDTNLMRNVTIRPRKQRQPVSPTAGYHSHASGHTGNPRLPVGLPNAPRPSAPTRRETRQPDSDPDALTSTVARPTRRVVTNPDPRAERELQVLNGSADPQSPNSDSSRDMGWPSQIKHMSPQYRSSSDPKRFSTMSNNSTIVEAVVIPTPPKQRRGLRHMSKNFSLRSEAGSSIGSLGELAPVSPSNRLSFGSDEPIRHGPHDIGSSNGEGDIAHSQRSGEHISSYPPIELKHHEERWSLRADAEAPARVTEPLRTPMMRTQRPKQDPKWMLRDRNVGRGSGSKRPATAAQGRSETRTTGSAQEHPSYSGTSAALTRSLTQKALKAVIPVVTVDAPASEATEPGTEQRLTQNGKRRIASEPANHLRWHEEVETQAFVPVGIESDSVAVFNQKDTVTGDVTSRRSRPSIERIPTNESFGARRSFDRLTVASHEHPRMSLDRSTIRTEEHANARHLYAQSTPFSQISDTPAEVSEARAVSIYPHNNHSLLVVQQGSRPVSTTRQYTEEPMADQELPAISFEPSTPPNQTVETIGVDSPLKNPRKAPLPAIKILPATPAEELQSPLDDPAFCQPERRPTLLQRARRYSETMVQPLFARTASIRQSVKKPRRPATSEGGQDCDGKLHPFWHPRAFWDDVSDSDSEFGDVDGGVSRLPPGGDTSEVGEPRGFAKLVDGIRRSGSGAGFLIGNTLGMERHGTNRRKPRIPAPTNLNRTSSGRIVRASGSSGSLRTSSVRMTQMQTQTQKAQNLRVWNGPRGLQVHWVGVGGLVNLWEERRREKRRAEIRKSIGPRFVVEGAPLSD